MSTRQIAAFAFFAAFIANEPSAIAADEFPPGTNAQLQADAKLAGRVIEDLYGFTSVEATAGGFGKLNDTLPSVWLEAVFGKRLCRGSRSFDGCPLVLIRKEGGEMHVIGKLAAVWYPLIASAHKTNGWADLLYWAEEPTPNNRRYGLARFDGVAYVVDESTQSQAELRAAAERGRVVFTALTANTNSPRSDLTKVGAGRYR